MAKNIVVFSDGTGQDGGVRPDQRLSNVYKLYRACRSEPTSPIDPSEQVAFYDPGLGTDDDVHGFGKAWRTIEKLLGSVAGRGIGTNIIDCYEFIINYWQPGDRIYIIGFSRGAYTARCIAQVLSLCGVPRHQAGEPEVPFRRFARSTRLAAARAVHQVYEHGAGHPREEFEAERDEQARRFRADYGSDSGGVPNASPYFIGVFDTVAALGAKGWKFYGIGAILGTGIAIIVAAVAVLLHWIVGTGFLATFGVLTTLTAIGIWAALKRQSMRYIDNFPTEGSPRRRHWIAWHASNYDRGLSRHVGFARHASAIDEDRADFPRVGWGRHDVVRPAVDGEPLPLVQLWFAGDHSDIGGSYPESESRLSDISLQWMVDEATTLPEPLIVDRARLATWPDPTAMHHSEVVAVRDRTLWWVPKWAPRFVRDGWASAARAPAGEPVHPSVHARFATASVALPTGQGPYRPANLADDLRFRHFYNGSDPVTAEASAAAQAARYRIHATPPIDWRVGESAAAIVRLRHDCDAEMAVIIAAAPWGVVERDCYRDQLSINYLGSQLTRRGLGMIACDVRRPDDPLFTSPALVVPGADRVLGAQLAQMIGQRLFVELARDGSGLVRTAFDRVAAVS